MKKGQKRKQKKAERRRKTRGELSRHSRTTGQMSALQHMRQARRYPIEGCWVMPGWQEGGLAVIAVARRQANNNLVFGAYLVDIYCLGVKNAWFDTDVPSGHFLREMLPEMMGDEAPEEISPALAHEIIYGAIEFAQAYGFRPHRDFRRARNILDPPDHHPRSGTVVFGREGKPLFISGPYDNVDAILRQLQRTAGEGNYHFVAQVGGPFMEIREDDEWDDE